MYLKDNNTQEVFGSNELFIYHLLGENVFKLITLVAQPYKEKAYHITHRELGMY